MRRATSLGQNVSSLVDMLAALVAEVDAVERDAAAPASGLQDLQPVRAAFSDLPAAQSDVGQLGVLASDILSRWASAVAALRNHNKPSPTGAAVAPDKRLGLSQSSPLMRRDGNSLLVAPVPRTPRRLLAPLRKTRKSTDMALCNGYLKKNSSSSFRGWQRRWFALRKYEYDGSWFYEVRYWRLQKEELARKSEIRGRFPVSQILRISRRTISGRKYSFGIDVSTMGQSKAARHKRTYHLEASCEEDKERWIRKLSQAIEEEAREAEKSNRGKDDSSSSSGED